MGARDIPDDVRELLRKHIETYEQLEVLLLLRREGGGAWTPINIATRLNMPAALVDGALVSLQASGLVERRSAQPEHQFACSMDQAINETLDRLEHCYLDRPTKIIELMSTNAIERVRTSALRTFTEAFVLRKDK